MTEQRYSSPKKASHNNNINSSGKAFTIGSNNKEDLSKIDKTEETMSQYSYLKKLIK